MDKSIDYIEKSFIRKYEINFIYQTQLFLSSRQNLILYLDNTFRSQKCIFVSFSLALLTRLDSKSFIMDFFPMGTAIRLFGILHLYNHIVVKTPLQNTAWKVSVCGVLLVRIFPHSDWILKDTPYLSVFSPNAGKYGPEKLRIRTLFRQWKWLVLLFSHISS